MLSLSPRYDLFRFTFPKDFIPEEINEKYAKILSKNPAVINTPIDYLNESILGVSFPGISEINMIQELHGKNSISVDSKKNPSMGRLGRLNVEPKHEVVYTSSTNPLESINKEFKVTMRMNLGLYNYFMLYEIIFYYICKPINRPPLDFLYVDMLDEDGIPTSRIVYKDVYIDGLEGLDFSYNKIERDSGTFDITFKFNNVDFEFLNINPNVIHTP